MHNLLVTGGAGARELVAGRDGRELPGLDRPSLWVAAGSCHRPTTGIASLS